MLCYGIHAFGTYLYLYPTSFGAHYGGVQRLIAVALGHRQPVAQTVRVRRVHVGNHRIYMPAFALFVLRFTVNDDAYGKEVVYLFERSLLLLHLLPDGVY